MTPEERAAVRRRLGSCPCGFVRGEDRCPLCDDRIPSDPVARAWFRAEHAAVVAGIARVGPADRFRSAEVLTLLDAIPADLDPHRLPTAIATNAGPVRARRCVFPPGAIRWRETTGDALARLARCLAGA